MSWQSVSKTHALELARENLRRAKYESVENHSTPAPLYSPHLNATCTETVTRTF